jgi:hypothetical protein
MRLLTCSNSRRVPLPGIDPVLALRVPEGR